MIEPIKKHIGLETFQKFEFDLHLFRCIEHLKIVHGAALTLGPAS